MLFNKFEAKMRNFFKIIVYFFLFSSTVSCGGFKKVDARKIPISGPERAKQNVKEGRGASLKNIYSQYIGELSMGMSEDYEIALDYGATIVRVGSKIFT